MWDGWGQQHEVIFQTPEIGLLNVFISWQFFASSFQDFENLTENRTGTQEF
jgi:hypothetical protein